MKRLLTGLLLIAVLAGTAAAGVAKPERVLAVEWQAGGGKLRWVSPTTMRPVGSAVLNVGGAPADILAISPDGALAAIGGGENGRLRFVRLDGLRPAGLMWLGGASAFKGIWSAPDRLVVLVGGETAEVVVVDPAARRVLQREPLPGLALGVARAGNRLLTLLAPRGRIGTAQLVAIEADGTVRTVALDGISAGFAPPAATGAAGRQASPALAANGSRAVVVGVDRLAEIKLETMAVTGRPIVGRTTQRAAKLLHGWQRSAVWLRGDTVAFWGSTMGPEGPGSIGVRLLNVATGTERMLDAFALEAARAGSTLLTYGRDELVGYRLDATKRFTVLQGTDTGYVQTAGRWAYVGSGNSTRFAVVDVAGGRVVGHVRTAKPTTVFVP
jgi:hypothetical protein